MDNNEQLTEQIRTLRETFMEEIRALKVQINKLLEVTESRPKEFLTVEEAAKFTRCSKGTIYNKVNKGKIPSIKDGGKLLFSTDELTEWLKSKSTTPAPSKDDRFIVGGESVRIRRR